MIIVGTQLVNLALHTEVMIAMLGLAMGLLNSRAALMASVWAGFLTGAIVSGAASLYFGVRVLLPPCLIMLALAVSGGIDRTHSTKGSTRH